MEMKRESLGRYEWQKYIYLPGLSRFVSIQFQSGAHSGFERF
jgi:hypothetical protein